MDHSRRAKANNPLPESRRASDFYRPVTTAAYGTPIPLLIGQHRIPTTIIRDGRNVGGSTGAAIDGTLHYGLCEGPIKSVGKLYANQGDVFSAGSSADVGVHTTASLPWVAAVPATSNISIEASTEVTLAGADATYLPFLSGGDVGVNSIGQPLQETDFHYCATGTGADLKEYVVVWSQSAQTLQVRSRTAGGAWSLAGTITASAVNPSVLPAVGALVQPRVAAVGNLVHVVWSRLDNTLEPVQICHAWSTDGGLSWAICQSMGTVTKAYAIGAFKLSLSVHSSGEVWICFQKRNYSDSQTPLQNCTSGICVGYKPSWLSALTPWKRPDLTSLSSGRGLQGELCLVDPSSTPVPLIMKRNLLRAPSILAVGDGKALLSCVFNAPPGPAASLYILPIKADTIIKWDLPAAALDLRQDDPEPHTNVASIVWLEANGYSARTLGWTPNSGNDLFNEGHTQIVGSDAAKYAVLVNHAPVDTGRPDWTPAGSPAKWMWGAWKVYSVSTAGRLSVDLTTASSPGFSASAFWNGAGQVFVAFGRPTVDDGWTYTAPKVHIMCVNLGARKLTDWCEYFPATSLNNSMAHQMWAGNGEAFALFRENEDNDTYWTCGIREVTHTTGYGDVLPSVICKRLLTGDDQRGLAIRGLAFDPVTWDKFDAYCTAMNIRFSLIITSQEAAWPLVVNILESANAVPFRSQGLLKVFVRETATIGTYTPLPEHAAPCMTIPAGDLQEPGISIEPVGIDAMWNRLTVNWKNRTRAYADEPTTQQDEGAVSRRGVIPASSCDWHWITDGQTALTCLWLRMRHQQRTGRTYSFTVSQKYMLLEPGDIVTVGHNQITPRPVRILEISEGDGDWRQITTEDVVVAATSAAPPGAPGGSTPAAITIARPINLPIIFIALIGGLLQVWMLLSGPSGWRGCTVQQSWDGVAWETVGTCTTPSPTGHLLRDMSRLRVQPGLRVHPGLLAGAADFALGDYSESTALPPWPAWGDFLAGSPGALLWVDGELIAYAAESDDGVSQAQCSIMRRGLYGTTKGPHPILSRCGAVADAAFRWAIPAGNNGRTCHFRFPSFGEVAANVQTYSVEIPA